MMKKRELTAAAATIDLHIRGVGGQKRRLEKEGNKRRVELRTGRLGEIEVSYLFSLLIT